MGFSGSVNGTTKNPGFLDFGFCQCKWAYWEYFPFQSLITLSHHCSDQTDVIIHSYPDMGHTQVLIGLKSIQTSEKVSYQKDLWPCLYDCECENS